MLSFSKKSIWSRPIRQDSYGKDSFRRVLGILLILFSSCGGDKSSLSKDAEPFDTIKSDEHPFRGMPESGTIIEKIMKSDSGIFRGTELCMSLEKVKSKETIPPSEEDSLYLYYEVALDSANSLTVAYDFDEKGLKEIQADIFLKNENQFNDLLKKFKIYFHNKYGEGENANGFWVWTIKEKQRNIQIALSDESTDYQYSKLSLSVYNADY